MRVADFDFDLPESLIALRPANPRDSARMLVVREDGNVAHAFVRELPDILGATDVLVLNDTKVIRARLHGRRVGRPTEPNIEILLNRRVASDCFEALARPARKLATDDTLALGRTLRAIVLGRTGTGVALRFNLSGAELDRAIAAEGEVPLPPYILKKRPAVAEDVVDYQTVFATHEGSVAAPTAGLHFTPDLLARLAAKGMARESVTLHVGAGTFLPVSVEDTAHHEIHPETATLDPVTAARLDAARKGGRRIVAVGTTSLRTLESATSERGIGPFAGETSLFITPGYRFKAVDVLLTNFHLPRSTLFMLVSAFSGLENMRRAYAEAIAARYRFYSYGDACLLFRPR